MQSSVAEHVYQRIRQSELVEGPFPHFYVTDLFPADFYAELTRNLPDDARYTQFPPPYQARHAIELNHESAAALGEPYAPFWVDFVDWLHSQELLDQMAGKFGPHLKAPYKYRKKKLQTGVDEQGRVRVLGRSLLSRDYCNFAMAPHSDTEHKFIVGAFYLSTDERLKEFGTSIYKPKQDGLTDWRSTRHDRSQFDLVRTVENLPNSLFVFMKTDNSFHGVEEKPYPDIARDVLFWTPHLAGKHDPGVPLSLPREMFVDDRSWVSRLLGR